MLISSAKPSLAITSIAGTTVNHSEMILLSHCLCYGLWRRFEQNKGTAVSVGQGGVLLLCLWWSKCASFNAIEVLEIAESQGYLRQVLWGLHAHTVVALGWGYFGEENFAATRGFRDIGAIVCIKYTCLLSLLLCLHVSYHSDICADEFCHWKLG